MKKSFGFVAGIVIALNALSQTETFDIVTFTPPKDWKKDEKPGLITYMNVNEAKGNFCILAIYASVKSSGDANKDFKNQWDQLIANPYKLEANPKTETQVSPDGWKAVTGAGTIKLDGIEAYAVLTVCSGFEKVVTILAEFNDQAYIEQIDAVMQNMDLDKTAVIKEKNSNAIVNTSNASGGPIVGVWSTTAVAIGNYVTSSGAFVGSADVSTMEEYEFRANNTYLYKFFGSMSGKLYYTETSGTYSINGRNLSLNPKSRRGGFNSVMRDEKDILEKPAVVDWYIGPNKWDQGPYLNLHQEGKYYMYSDFPYDYFKKIGESQSKTENNSKGEIAKTTTNEQPLKPVTKKPVPKKTTTVKKPKKTTG